MERFWFNFIFKYLRVEFEDYYFFFIELFLNFFENCENMVEIFFEFFNCVGLYIVV